MTRSTNRIRLSFLPVSPAQVAIASRPHMGKRGLGRCIVAFLLLCALVISACNSTTEPAEEAVETDSGAAAVHRTGGPQRDVQRCAGDDD